MPNLRGVSPVGRDVGGRLTATQTVSRDGPSRWRSWPVEFSARGRSVRGTGGVRAWTLGVASTIQVRLLNRARSEMSS